MGDFLRRVPQFSLEIFHAFRDERPKEEKWELIDGVPVMMPPPTLVHQRIARNLAAALNEHLVRVRPEWQADHEIGILLPHDEKFNPEPDVTVIDAEIALGQLYAQRFYFVAEVLSESDKAAVLAAKLAYCQEHAPCRGVLFIRQDRIAATPHANDGGWRELELRNPRDRIAIPDIGDIGLAALYRHTPHWRTDFAR